MIRLILVHIFFITNSFAIGLQGLVIPQNGQILAMSGSGIAGDIDPALNPAMKIIDHQYMQFSLNHWLGDIKGSQTIYYFSRDERSSACDLPSGKQVVESSRTGLPLVKKA